MKLLTKHTDYAIRALLVLAKEKGAFISARQIAASQNIPYQFLRRILQELIKHKLVVSKEGGKGGFRINKKPKFIKCEQIMKIFQGNICLSECMFKRKLCANRPICVLRKRILKIEDMVSKEFSKITIAGLLKDLPRTRARFTRTVQGSIRLDDFNKNHKSH